MRAVNPNLARLFQMSLISSAAAAFARVLLERAHHFVDAVDDFQFGQDFADVLQLNDVVFGSQSYPLVKWNMVVAPDEGAKMKQRRGSMKKSTPRLPVNPSATFLITGSSAQIGAPPPYVESTGKGDVS